MTRSSDKENTLCTATHSQTVKLQQVEDATHALSKPARTRKRSFVDVADGACAENFVGKAKRAIKRGCTEMGIRKYASLSSMTASHQSNGASHPSHKRACATRKSPARVEPSSEATIIVLGPEDDDSADAVVLESQLTIVEPSSPVRELGCDDVFASEEPDLEPVALPLMNAEDMPGTFAELSDWLRSVEGQCATGLAGGLARHAELSARMRPILVDWLMEVAADYRMHRQTLHLTVQFLDRFLAHTDVVVQPSMLQCYGTACLALAMKAEEQRVPTLTELTDFSKDAFTRDQLKQAEIDVLVALRWRLAVPTLFEFLALMFQRSACCFPALFADRTSVAPCSTQDPATTSRQFDARQFATACDFADALLHVQDSLRFPASELAAACFYLGTAPNNLDGASFARCTGYSFPAVWAAILHAKQLKAALDPVAARSLCPAPCCDTKDRYANHLARIRPAELWTYQPHHAHLLDQFENFASR
ncbi:Cyclin-A2 [Coemansia sp. RSA 1199]|nr:Cyclin-A2 [Coemansia sp. RSA 1199]